MAVENELSGALKKPFEMTFEEFAAAVRPSGAVNRFPPIGAGFDVFSYTVYMNGPLASALPVHSREHTFKDVTLHALTEKLKLSPESARDNLKVAELVALRSSWMSAVLESSVLQPSSERIVDDYTLLTNGMTHPWITGELQKQRALSSKLQPMLARAAANIGNALKDVVPYETSVGMVVAQDLDFTVQQTTDGEVVTHENRRLNTLPVVGSKVMVSYYRGSGQVVNSLENVKISPPFIDANSSDLAVRLEDGEGVAQVILFNSISGFEKFVKAHALSPDLVRQAMDVREAMPKVAEPVPSRELVASPYLDKKSGCLAIGYKEHGVEYSALFSSAGEMASLAKNFDLGPNAIAKARALEASSRGKSSVSEVADRDDWKERSSDTDLRADLVAMGHADIQQRVNGSSYVGKVVAERPLHVAQHIGRGTVVIHDLRTLDKVPAVGDTLTVKYENGRGRVTDMAKADKDMGR